MGGEGGREGGKKFEKRGMIALAGRGKISQRREKKCETFFFASKEFFFGRNKRREEKRGGGSSLEKN